MNNEIENQLMQDPEIVRFLKSAILSKSERHNYLLKIRRECPDSKIDQILRGPITEGDIRLIFDRFEADEEIKRVELNLSRMCYTLNNSKYGKSAGTDWGRAYERATRYVRIEDVIRFLTGQENFNRNIKCPFHEDRKASLKVYLQNNRFVCFGCGIRGSPLDFVMQYKNCSFQEAVLFLSNL